MSKKIYKYDRYLNEIVVKNKADFQKVVDYFCKDDNGELYIDFEQIKETPRYIRVVSGYNEKKVAAAIAYYLMYKLDLEAEPLTIKTITDFVGIIDLKNHNIKKYVEWIIYNSEHYSEILDMKDTMKNKEFLLLGYYGISAMLKDGCSKEISWHQEYWGAAYNVGISSVNKEGLSFTWISTVVSGKDVVKEMHKKLGIDIYYRYIAVEPLAVAAEMLLSSKGVNEKSYYFVFNRALYDIYKTFYDDLPYTWDEEAGYAVKIDDKSKSCPAKNTELYNDFLSLK